MILGTQFIYLIRQYSDLGYATMRDARTNSANLSKSKARKKGANERTSERERENEAHVVWGRRGRVQIIFLFVLAQYGQQQQQSEKKNSEFIFFASGSVFLSLCDHSTEQICTVQYSWIVAVVIRFRWILALLSLFSLARSFVRLFVCWQFCRIMRLRIKRRTNCTHIPQNESKYVYGVHRSGDI